jgi:hypothetical protein
LELLTQLLAQGKNLIGELALANDFSLRHCEDLNLELSQLQCYHHPEAAREIARYDAAGKYRPLKTASNLRRGWVLQLRNMEEVALALDFFYPAALNLYATWLGKKIKTTSLRETLNRQSGMYRVTQRLSDEQAGSLIQQQCHKGCLRKILWSISANQETNSLIVKENEIPLFCREACNLFVAAARHAVKENSQGWKE